MLEFIRRYQRYFFAIITFVIVISFSFFGTYSTVSVHPQNEQVVFKAIDGNSIKRGEIEQMALFLGTDTEDKAIFGGMWGPNFLNDGVIKKDLLQTGIAEILAQSYLTDLAPDLQERLQQEKRFEFYSHPKAKFLGQELAWSYFAPEISKQIAVLKQTQNAATPDALQARIKLFLAERQFPPPLLKQVLRAQERQYQWLEHDPMLDRGDFSIYGHHTVEDWFGPRFVRLAAQFIVNSAKVAEQRGYTISDAEVLADLARNSAQSFQQQKNSPYLGVATQQEYFLEQLRRLNLDQNKAIKIWKQVLLSRRLFQDMGSSVLVDSKIFEPINQYAKETIEGSIYQLPEPLRLHNFHDLQKFEIYLQAVTSKAKNDQSLNLPQEYLSIADVANSAPELVQKQYHLELASVDQKRLQARVSVKEMWNWQVQDANWKVLKEKFPQLGLKPATTRQERLEALESLDGISRSQADQFAREAITAKHPEWAKEALDREETQPILLNLSLKGKVSALKGILNAEKFQAVLDQAPLSDTESDEQKASPELEAYTQDGQTFYRIYVIERNPQENIMTFAAANESGVLEDLLNKKLSAHYDSIRNRTPELYKNGNDWKPLAEVRNQVAESYFADLLQAIAKQAPKGNSNEKLTGDQAAALRLYPYVTAVYQDLLANPKNEKQVTTSCNASNQQQDEFENHSVKRHEITLEDQWKLEKCFYSSNRGSEKATFAGRNLFEVPIGSWTEISTPPNGDLAFIQILHRGNSANESTVNAQVIKAQQLLGDEAERMLARQLLRTFKEKGAISLDYLNKTYEEGEEPAPQSKNHLEPNLGAL